MRSLRNKVEMFNVLLFSLGFPEILCLSETWLSDSEAAVITLQKYNNASFYCRDKIQGGGVAIFVREDLHFRELNLKKIARAEKYFEAVSAVIEINKVKVNISCLYRSPNMGNIGDTCFAESLEKLLTLVNKNAGPNFVCGDFNYNFAKNEKDVINISNLFLSFGFRKCFSHFSRIQGSSKSIIDNVFTNMNTCDLKMETRDVVFSDHNAQILTLNPLESHTVPSSTILTKRSLSDVNKTTFKFLLLEETWEEVYGEPNRTLKFNSFFKIFSNIFNIAFPYNSIIVKTSKKSKEWITPSLIKKGNFLKNLHSSVKSSNDPELRLNYNALKKQYEKDINDTKKMFYEQKISNSTNKSKAVWNIIQSNIKMGKEKSKLPNKLKLDNDEFENPNDIADAFNNFFVDSVNNHTANYRLDLSSLEQIDRVSNSVFLSPVTVDETYKIINSVCDKKSSGIDEVPCYLLKDVLDYIIAPLTYLLNISFEIGHFPEQLKSALVVPIYKKCDPANIENYRPVALLSVFSKIFEKAFLNRITSFIHKNDILTPYQFGFTKGRSTQDAVLSSCNAILENFDDKQKTAGIFFDFSRAFDTINHNLLLEKLELYGFRGLSLSWVKTYLKGRTQSLKITRNGSSCTSNNRNIESGVPQGSIMGPVLFLLFINDIVKHINDCSVTLYADDISTVVSASNIDLLSRKVTTCAAEVSAWCQRNGLLLNSKKTQLLLFSPVGTIQNLSLLARVGSQSIEQHKATKFLGLHIDSNLSWDIHVTNLIKNLASKNFAILQLRNVVGIDTVKNYYFGCVQSVLNYGILCWGNCSKIQSVFILQKRIIRTMFKLYPTTPCRAYFQSHGILTIYCLYILQAVCHVRKNIHSLPKCNDINKYNTRKANDIYVPTHRLTQTNKGPTITSIKLYNHLPQRIKNLPNYGLFSASVKQLLKQQSFYSLQEFFNFKF